MPPGHDRAMPRPTGHVGPRRGHARHADPPLLAAWLLARLAPRRLRDAALGDLYEEYVEFVVAELGRRRARLWYWSQVVVLLIRYRTPYGFVARGIRDALGAERRLAVGVLARDARQAARALRAAPAFSRVAVLMLASGAGIVAALVGGGSRRLAGPLPSETAPLVAVVDRTDTTPAVASSPAPVPPPSVSPKAVAARPAVPVVERVPVVARVEPPKPAAEAASTSPVVAFDSASRQAAANVVVGMDPLSPDSGKPLRPRKGPYQDETVQP